jgi:hypothetical protein
VPFCLLISEKEISAAIISALCCELLLISFFVLQAISNKRGNNKKCNFFIHIIQQMMNNIVEVLTKFYFCRDKPSTQISSYKNCHKKSESIFQYPRHDAGNITCLSKPEGSVNILKQCKN